MAEGRGAKDRIPVLPPPDLTPDTEGTLGQTPLLSVLVSSLRRALTGTLTITSGPTTHALQLALGTPVRAFTPEPWALLGEVVVQLGFGTDADIQAGLDASRTSGALLGSHLIARRVLSQVDLTAALRAQITTRLVAFANLPDAATFAFYRDRQLLRLPGTGEDTPIDPLAATLAVARGYRAGARLDATLAKLDKTPLKLHARAELMRFAMTGDETLAAERVRREKLTYGQLVTLVGVNVARPLVYALAVTRHLDLGSGEDPYDAAAADADAMRKRTVQASATGRSSHNLPPPGARAVTPSHHPAARSRTAPPMEIPAGARNVTVQAVPHRREPAPPTSDPAPPSRGPLGSAPLFTPEPPRPVTPSARSITQQPSARSITQQPITQPGTPASASRQPVSPDGRRALVRERLAHVDGDLYALLGVEPTATSGEIQTAYLQGAKLFHPDKLPADLADLRTEAASLFSALSRAQRTLSDAHRRAEYDASRASGAAKDDGGEVVRALDALSAFQRAEILVKRGDFAGAEPLARAACEGDRSQGTYFALLGWIRAMRGEQFLPEALQLLDEAVRLGPKLDGAFYYRGVVKKRLGRPDAIRDFREAAELNPRNIDAAREVRLAGIRAQHEKEPEKPTGLGRFFGKKP